MSEWKTKLILPDLQIPEHHSKTLANFIQFIKDYQPDELWNVGDFLDSPEPSRWSKGSALEYLPTLQGSINKAIKVHEDIRAVYDKPMYLRMGNHDERIETYVCRYAPALSSLTALKYESLLETDRLGIKVLRTITDIAPGWVIAHGHEGSMRQGSGQTALALGTRIGKSVVCGHSHKAALIHGGPQGYNGKEPGRIWGMEVGHCMDLRKAHYLKTGGANWNKGLGLLRVKGSRVEPVLITVDTQGRFQFEGKEYA